MLSSQEHDSRETEWLARRETYITRIEVLVEALAEEVRGIREEVDGIKADTAMFRRDGKSLLGWTISLTTIILILTWVSTLALIFVRT